MPRVSFWYLYGMGPVATGGGGHSESSQSVSDVGSGRRGEECRTARGACHKPREKSLNNKRVRSYVYRSASFIHEIAWLGLGEIFFNQEYITYWHRLQSSWQTHINKTQDYIAALDRTQTHLRLFQDLLTLYSLCSA